MTEERFDHLSPPVREQVAKALHPRRNTDADHMPKNVGKSLVEKIQDHLDGLISGANQHGCKLRGTHSPDALYACCRECYSHELAINEAAGCAGALAILRSTSLDVEMDLANERLGYR